MWKYVVLQEHVSVDMEDGKEAEQEMVFVMLKEEVRDKALSVATCLCSQQ